jgi:hypothetical protein
MAFGLSYLYEFAFAEDAMICEAPYAVLYGIE